MVVDIKERSYFSESGDSGSRVSFPFCMEGKVYVLLRSGEVHVLDGSSDRNNAFSYLDNIYPDGTDLVLGGAEANGFLMAGGRVWSPRLITKDLIDPLIFPCASECYGDFFIVGSTHPDRALRKRMLIGVSSDGGSYRSIIECKGIASVPDSDYLYVSDDGVSKLFRLNDSKDDVVEVAVLDESSDPRPAIFGGDGSVFRASSHGLVDIYDSRGVKDSLDLGDVFQSLGVTSIRQVRYYNGVFVLTYFSASVKRYLMAVIDSNSLDVVWRSDVPRLEYSYGGFVLHGNFSFVLHNSAVSMIDLANGDILWSSAWRNPYLDQCRRISEGMICFWSYSASSHGVFLDLSAL